MKTSNAQLTIACLAFFSCALLNGAPGPETVCASIQAPDARKAAPAFSLLDSSGKAVRLRDYRGKVVLLNFWATDCGGCRLEIPWFVELDRAYKDKAVAVVGVSMDISYESLKDAKEAWSRVKPFVQTHQIGYAILMGDDEATKAYDIQALPATYLIDPSGRIAAQYIGLIDKENVKTNIDALLTKH